MPARASSRTATRTACAPRTSTRSWTPSTGRSRSRATRAWCRWPRSSANDFNLNLPRYIDSTEPEDLQDIEAHLKGGIPDRDIDALDRLLAGASRPCAANCSSDADRAGYSQLKIDAGADQSHHLRPCRVRRVQPAGQRVVREVEDGQHAAARWHPDRRPAQGADRDHFRETCSTLSVVRPLIDPYDVYQHLMDYWAETMQDDVWQIALEGWKAVLEGKPNTDLIPEALIVARYFAAEAGRHRTAGSRARRHQPPDGGAGRGARRRGRAAGRRRRPTRASSPPRASRTDSRPSRATRTPQTSARRWSNTSPSSSRKPPRARR